jgi:hypothetical protein
MLQIAPKVIVEMALWRWLAQTAWANGLVQMPEVKLELASFGGRNLKVELLNSKLV